MTKIVNPYFLHVLMEPLTGMADDDDEVIRYSTLDTNDEFSVRKVIRNLIVPHAKSLTQATLIKVKLAYRYYLTISLMQDSDVKFNRVFDSNLPPFDHPSDPRLFFIWIWEECFPGEDYKLDNLESYISQSSISEH